MWLLHRSSVTLKTLLHSLSGDYYFPTTLSTNADLDAFNPLGAAGDVRPSWLRRRLDPRLHPRAGRSRRRRRTSFSWLWPSASARRPPVSTIPISWTQVTQRPRPRMPLQNPFLIASGPLGNAQAVIPSNSKENSGDGGVQGKQRVEMATEVRSQTTELLQKKTTEENLPKRGMILSFQPLSMVFHNVNYYVDMPKEMRLKGVPEKKLQLLSNVCGVFRPGVLTALVGSSGAGKTTLMDVLAGRKTGGYIECDIRISGYPKEQSSFARISGYVEQSDIHSPQVTVEESLWFSSCLRLPKEVSKENRLEFVEEVMALVELDTLRHALVGLPGSTGLSTEQRKRLTIAVELVSNPSIVFMDEPTSGLDARAAVIVMRTVRNTVDTGRTVVCTIHQPSIDIFEAFDVLLLVKQGGRVIYGGLLGVNSHVMLKYFQGIIKRSSSYS